MTRRICSFTYFYSTVSTIAQASMNVLRVVCAYRKRNVHVHCLSLQFYLFSSLSPLIPTFGALCFGSRSLFRALTTSRSPLHFCTNTRAFIINVQRRITIFTQHRWSPTRTQRAMRLQRNDLCTETKCYLSVYARSARKRKRKGQKGRKG